METNRKNTGWILCPSKSFPGKFYYFNVATGETAWCLSETERQSLKNSPLQRADHCYPEPNSPPADEPPISNQHTVKFNPYNERTISNYPQDTYNISKNLSTFVQPIEQFSKSVPYQIQLPMIWPSGGSMPQVIMIVMNQAMRQLAIEEPKSFRQPHQTLEPNQILDPRNLNRGWTEPNRAWNEPNRAWKEPYQAQIQRKEPDREIFTHSGTVPLCERFINYKKPIDKEIEPSQHLSNKNQNDLSTKKSYVQAFSQKQSINCEGYSNQNNENLQNTMLRKPIFNFTDSLDKTDMFMPSTSHSIPSTKNFPKSSQNVFKPDQSQLGQSHTNKSLFGQSQPKQQIFGQSCTNKKSFGRTKQFFGHSEGNQELFGQRQTIKENGPILNQEKLFGQSPIKQACFGQSQTISELYGQSQTKQGLLRQTQPCPKVFQSSNFESNPFQKLIIEKNSQTQFTKPDFSMNPVKSNLKIPSYEELNHGANAEEKATLITGNKADNSQEDQADLQVLDKNDLRRILMDKKRKSTVLDQTQAIESKKIKTCPDKPTMTVPKKKVTFNLPECFSDSEKDAEEEIQYQEEPASTDSWYMVSDAKSLLEDFDFLNNIVRSDPTCNLIIPSRVMSDIVALSRGECRERSLVTLARHLLRGLSTSYPRIIVQESDMSYISTDDSILNCCLEVMDKACVILVTSDEDLQRTAEYLNINCFTSDQIKNGQAKQSKVRFDVKKVKISITDEHDNVEVPTKQFENMSFGAEHWKNNWSSQSQSIFDKGQYKNGAALSKPSVFSKGNANELESTKFDIDTYKNRKTTQSSIFFGKTSESQTKYFDTDKNNQPKPVAEKENVSNNKYLEQFLKSFCEKNRNIEHLVEERKDEIGCGFTQIMEECFNDILQSKTNIIELKHRSTPLWTLAEGLECLTVVYSNHTYIRDVVSVFTSVLNATNEVPARDVIRTIGCGVALVKYLKFITPTTEVLSDTEDALNSILAHMTEDTDALTRVPAFTATDNVCAERKANFVKDRSEVVKFLKKHFPAWANYDETLEDNTWGMNCNDPMVVRTYGKNLGMLKLNNSKPMSMDHDSSQNIQGNTKNTQTTQNGIQNVKRNVNFENNTNNENMNAENIVSKANFDKNNINNLKLVRVVNTEMPKNDQKLKSTQEITSKQTEPKVVRLFSKIDFNKESRKAALEKSVLDDSTFELNGHTFGTKLNGPKVLRNIKPITEFEEKFKIGRKCDLDDVNDSIISKSDENNNFASESTNNNCLSMSLENLDNRQKDNLQFYKLDAKNDVLDGKNDKDATNDTQNFDSNHNNTATNNGQPMSVECIKNNFLTIDIDDILAKNDMISNNFDSDFNIVDYGINDLYDAINDYQRNVSFEANDVVNDIMVPKDDSTNDSGFESASQQAYHLMDTFLYEIKESFKAIHTFLGNSVRELRSGPLSVSASRIVRDTATTARAHLNKIVHNLDGIIQREASSGPKLQELVAGAGSLAGSDNRIKHYREIVVKCCDHARLIDNALRDMLSVTNDRKR